MYGYVRLSSDVHRGQQKASDHQELELQAVVSLSGCFINQITFLQEC